jgi:MFS family permease
LVSLAFLISSLLRRRLVEETEKPEVKVKDVFDSLGSAASFTEGLGVWRELPRMLTTLLSVELLYLIPNVMFNTVMILYMTEDLGITEVQLSYLGPIIGISMMFLSLPAGKVVDRFGSVKPLLFAYALTFFAVPLLFDASFTQLVLATPIIGLLNVLFYTATQSLWAGLIPDDVRGRVMGSKAFFNLLAVASGNIIGGLIYDYVSHVLPIYLFMAVCIPSFLLTWRYIKEPEKLEKVVDEPV